jgi:TetR/AcrR family transcriptional regulator, copper-responsive repressor
VKPRAKRRRTGRDALINMAADLFRTEGFDGTTLDHISKQTGVSRFKLYAWFGSKEGILRAAFNATWAQINEKVTAKLSGEMTLRQTFEIVLSVILDFAERRDPIAALFLEFSRRHGVDGQLQPEVLRFGRILEDSIRRAVEQGEIHRIKPPLLRGILFALVEGLLYQAYLGENRTGFEVGFELGEIPQAVMRFVEPIFREAANERE